MNFIYEGMSPEELAAKRAELESELMAAQFEHEFESVQMMHELRLKDIEKQIILENCSIEKVADLYANEEDVYTEAEEGLIQKVFNILRGIIDAIFGITRTKVDPAEKNDQIELDVDIKTLNSGSKKVLDALRNLTSIKDPNTGKLNFGAIVFDGIAALAAVKGVSGLISAVKKKVTLSKAEAESEADELTKTTKQINEQLGRVRDSMKDNADLVAGAVNGVTPLLSEVRDTLNKVEKALGKPQSSNDSNQTDGGNSNGGNQSNPNGKTQGNNSGNDDSGNGSAGSNDGGSGNGGNGGKPVKNGKKVKGPRGLINDDPSLSKSERVESIINGLKPHLRIGDDGVLRCSDADKKKYLDDVVNELNVMASDNRLEPDDQEVYKVAADRLKKLGDKHKPAADGSADVEPFKMNAGIKSHRELALINLKKQVGFDPDDDTVTCTQEELDKYRTYYNNLETTRTWGDTTYDPGSIQVKAFSACASFLRHAKVQSGANDNANTGAAKSELQKIIERDLDLYNRNGKLLVGVSKNSYKQYIDALDETINKYKNDKKNQDKFNRANNLRKLAKQYGSYTDKAADDGDPTAWKGTSSVELSYVDDGNGGFDASTSTSKSKGSDPKIIRNLLKKPVAEGGFAIVFGAGNNAKPYSKELDTEDKYQKALDDLSDKIKKTAEGSSKRNELEKILGMAQQYKSQIFGKAPSNPQQQQGDSDSDSVGRYLSILEKIFGVDVNSKAIQNASSIADLDKIKLKAFENKFKGSDRSNKPANYGKAAHPEWSKIVAVQACYTHKTAARNNGDTELADLYDHAAKQAKNFNYPKWMLKTLADDPYLAKPGSGATKKQQNAHTKAMQAFQQMAANVA